VVPASASRRRPAARLRDERGQTFVEWLGGTAVMVVVVIAFFSVKPSFADQLKCAVGSQIDRIMSIEQKGECRIAEPKVRRTPASARPPRTAQDRADRTAVHRPGR
jgi:hypothetical protein